MMIPGTKRGRTTQTSRIQRWWVTSILTFVYLCLLMILPKSSPNNSVVLASSVSSSNNAAGGGMDASSSSVSASAFGGFPLAGIRPDVFVQAAPLIVAAVCSDGVVMIAAHTPDDDEPLLYYTPASASSNEEEEEPTNKENQDDNNRDHENKLNIRHFFRDLPVDYRGPYRIHVLDGSGAAGSSHSNSNAGQSHNILLATGWRADCEALALVGRKLSLQEINRFGGGFGYGFSNGHGAFLSKQLSLYLAQRAVSENYRQLSCAGLLISPAPAGRGNNNNNKSCRMWLIDCTAAYPVRAFCIGGGMYDRESGGGTNDDGKVKQTSSTSSSSAATFAGTGSRFIPVSNVVNQKLMYTDFSCLRKEEAIQKILQHLATGIDDNARPTSSPSQSPTDKDSLVRKGTRLEVATLDAVSGAFVRRSCRVV